MELHSVAGSNDVASDDEDMFPMSGSENTILYEPHNNADAQNIASGEASATTLQSSDIILQTRINVTQPEQRMLLESLLHTYQYSEDEGEDTMSLVSRSDRQRSRTFRFLNRSQIFTTDLGNTENVEITEPDLIDIAEQSVTETVATRPAGTSPSMMRHRRRRAHVLQLQELIRRYHDQRRVGIRSSSSAVESLSSTSDDDTASDTSRPINPIPPSEFSATSSELDSDSTTPTNLSENEDEYPATPVVNFPPEIVTPAASMSQVVVTPPAVVQTQADFVFHTESDRGAHKRKLPTPEKDGSKKTALETSQNDDDDSFCCPICFEPWTNSGSHRLTSLRCGHVFGKKCVERWLKGARKCPQCNSKATKSDLRIIYTKKLCAVDTTELEQALRSLDKEKSNRRECEMELAKVRMQYHMVVDERNKLKSRVSELQTRLVVSQHGLSGGTSSQQDDVVSTESSQKYCFIKSNLIIQSGGCRIMDFHPRTQQFAVSQPSPHSRFMNGFGVKRISAHDLKSGYFTLLHNKAIKDIHFSHLTDHHLLSASQDGYLRITDLMSNAKIHEYKVDKPLWSCCWDHKDRNIIYAGLGNGSIKQFDLRNTSDELSSIDNLHSRCPIVSLYHVPPTADEAFQGRGGLFTGTLEGASFWQDFSSSDNQGPSLVADFKPSLLPLEPGGCTGLQYCRDTHHCLVTYRPGRKYRTTTHLLCELQCRTQANASGVISCNVIHSYTGGHAHTMLTRNALFVLPSSNNTKSQQKTLLACVGDEGNKKVNIYDSSRSHMVQSVDSEGGPPLDIVPVHMDGFSPMLGVLSQTTLKVFRFG